MADNKKNVMSKISMFGSVKQTVTKIVNVAKTAVKTVVTKNATVKTTPKNVNEMTPEELKETMATCREEMLDGLQTALDWIGIIPVFGDAFDVLNGIIYMLRGKYVDGLISFASAALSVAADTILKPLRYAKNGIKEIFETIVKKLPDLPSAASKILKGLAKTVDGLWLVGRKLKDSIIKGINTVIDFIVRHATEAWNYLKKKTVSKVAVKTASKQLKLYKRFGVGSYSALRKRVKEELKDEILEDSVEVHHLIEKRLIQKLGWNEKELSCIVVYKGEHQVFTNEWRRLIPYGTDYNDISAGFILEKAGIVYKDYPDLYQEVVKNINNLSRK